MRAILRIIKARYVNVTTTGKQFGKRLNGPGKLCWGAEQATLRALGAWLSLVESLVRDQEVGGSNPLAPTNFLSFDPKPLTPSRG
jgi:hypothetical protein